MKEANNMMEANNNSEAVNSVAVMCLVVAVQYTLKASVEEVVMMM